MVRLSVAIMAHPSREQLVAPLVDRLRADDPDLALTVVWDRANSIWDTGRRALLAAHPDATHHLVLQDDAVVCRDLTAGAVRLLGMIPEARPMGLYFGRTRAADIRRAWERAKRRHASWVVLKVSPTWGVAMVFPTTHIEELVTYGDSIDHLGYDGRVAGFYRRRRRVEQWYPLPSLVEHRGVPSIFAASAGRKDRERRAFRFIGEDRSALTERWTDVQVYA